MGGDGHGHGGHGGHGHGPPPVEAKDPSMFTLESTKGKTLDQVMEEVRAVQAGTPLHRKNMSDFASPFILLLLSIFPSTLQP